MTNFKLAVLKMKSNAHLKFYNDNCMIVDWFGQIYSSISIDHTNYPFTISEAWRIAFENLTKDETNLHT